MSLDNHYKAGLLRARAAIVKNVSDANPLVDSLADKLNDDERESIRATSNRIERTRKLLDILNFRPKLTSDFYSALIEAEYFDAAEALAKQLPELKHEPEVQQVPEMTQSPEGKHVNQRQFPKNQLILPSNQQHIRHTKTNEDETVKQQRHEYLNLQQNMVHGDNDEILLNQFVGNQDIGQESVNFQLQGFNVSQKNDASQLNEALKLKETNAFLSAEDQDSESTMRSYNTRLSNTTELDANQIYKRPSSYSSESR